MLLLMLLACGRGEDSAAPAPLTCTERFSGSAPATEADIVALVASARAGFFPTLGALSLEVGTMESADSYFVANLDLATISEAPLERDYRVLYSPVLFADPPDRMAVGAILVHELKHVLDYTALEADALVEFGLWYASGDDISDYEKQTDEYALESGCAAGLSAYREWVYAHIPEEDLQEKQETYYTPAEIAAWVAENE
ncbi:MAG: hypothetical protein P8R54_30565 [Myxococcota bacterium]|nr:hypothetical protein [Myxococcota bacterium]